MIPDAGQLLTITAIGLDSGNVFNPPNRGTLEIIEEGVALQYTPHPDNIGFNGNIGHQCRFADFLRH